MSGTIGIAVVALRLLFLLVPFSGRTTLSTLNTTLWLWLLGSTGSVATAATVALTWHGGTWPETLTYKYRGIPRHDR